MKTKVMAGAAIKSAGTIFKQMWEKTPKAIRRSAGSAVIVSMAASILAAPDMDEVGKVAVQDELYVGSVRRVLRVRVWYGH